MIVQGLVILTESAGSKSTDSKLRGKHDNCPGSNIRSTANGLPSTQKSITSVPAPTLASLGFRASALELLQKLVPSSVLPFSSSRSSDSSKAASAQFQITQISQSGSSSQVIRIEPTLANLNHNRDLSVKQPLSTEARAEITASMMEDRRNVYSDTESTEDDYEMMDVDESDETDSIDSDGSVASSSSLTADDGRPYNIWILADGRRMPTYGALLPTGYHPHHPQERPWICPVRSCQLVFNRLQGLGGHFNTKHRAEELNDNEDGTLTIKGIRSGGGRLPAIVVSKQPLDHNDSTMGEANLPGDLKARKDITTSAGTLNPMLSKTQPVTKAYVKQNAILGTGINANNGGLDELAVRKWKEVVHPNLKFAPLSPIPATGHVRELLPLKQKRGLELNPLARTYIESKAQDISAILIQISGEEAAFPCQRCQEGKGPFVGCVVISPHAPLHVRRDITSCANCFYEGCQSHCGDLSRWHRKTYPELSDGPEPGPVLRATNKPTLATVHTQSPGWHSARLQNPISTSPSTKSMARKRRDPSSFAESSNTRQPGPKRRRIENRLLPEDASVPLGNNHSISNAHVSPAITTEDWEVAPGLIRNQSSRPNESTSLLVLTVTLCLLTLYADIAFSSAYVAHGEEVVVGSDIGFHVLVINPGKFHHFSPATNRVRLCSVATGKVRVRTLNQEFDLGTHGMLKVMPDTIYILENLWYIDATIHVTAIPSEFV